MTYASLLEIAKNKREVSMSIDNRMDIHTTEHCIVIVPHNKDNLIYVNVSKRSRMKT